MNHTIRLAEQFSDFLINRDKTHGDGTFTGEEFRKKFLSFADDKAWWNSSTDVVTLDFKDVDTLGPSWANEVFAYFTMFGVDQKTLLARFRLINISDVKLALVKKEIDSGYKV